MNLLQEMQQEIVEWAESKGWEPDATRTFGDECALLHSEVSEALEAFRVWGFNDPTKTDAEIKNHHTASPHGFCSHSESLGQCSFYSRKPEGVGSEFADILIRLLHYAAVHNIDLYAEYARKMQYNKTRAYRHGGRAL